MTTRNPQFYQEMNKKIDEILNIIVITPEEITKIITK